jgi:hypothetical protein
MKKGGTDTGTAFIALFAVSHSLFATRPNSEQREANGYYHSVTTTLSFHTCPSAAMVRM